MVAVVDLILGLFVLCIVGSILYPFVLILFLVNRKVTNLLLPKSPSRIENNDRDDSQAIGLQFPNRGR
ncbi:MAG: hypothetical protein K6T83_13495 [Alicyclobacillus sp.]|nr:hypothetical protein [Alicyclobacillus sp.]